MQSITRRQSLRLLVGGAAASCVVGGLTASASADVNLSVSEPLLLRLNIEASLTKPYGKVKFIAYRESPVTKRHEQVALWGPFMNVKGRTKSMRLDPGTYTFASTGTAVTYTVVIETRPAKKGEDVPDYSEAGRLSGSYP